MLRYLKQLKTRQKAIGVLLIVVVGVVVPFFCNAEFDRIYNFYTDTQNENRITIKWTYGPDVEISAGAITFSWFSENVIWTLRYPVSYCVVNSENIFCYFVPTELANYYYNGQWYIVAENINGLTYDDVSEYLNPEFCLNSQRGNWLLLDSSGGQYEWNFSDMSPPSNPFCWGQNEIIAEGQVWGISPNSGTEITDLNTTLIIGYQDVDGYDSLYIALKHPQTGLFTNAKQYNISEIGQSGELEINLQNFNIEKNANWYLHAVATYEGYQYEDELFLSDYGWNWTGNLTDEYYYLNVNIAGFEEIFAMSDFNSWYAENAKFNEPTAMFSAIVGTFSPIFSVIGEFGNRIKDYFDLDSAYSKGYEIGKAIPIFSYYVGQITHFLGGFPIMAWLLIIILILVGIFIFRVILKFIPFLGGS